MRGLYYCSGAIRGNGLSAIHTNELDPFLDNIGGEEQFKKLMKRLKYEWEHFE